MIYVEQFQHEGRMRFRAIDLESREEVVADSWEQALELLARRKAEPQTTKAEMVKGIQKMPRPEVVGPGEK